MKDRILKIRKEYNLTQDGFAERLGLSKNFVWMLEKGEREPSDRTISDICAEFGINEDWLRSGNGEMLSFAEERLSRYLGKIAKGNDDFIKDLIIVYMELDETSKDALKEIAKRMADKQKKRGRN